MILFKKLLTLKQQTKNIENKTTRRLTFKNEKINLYYNTKKNTQNNHESQHILKTFCCEKVEKMK